jgi:hypothetical protein
VPGRAIPTPAEILADPAASTWLKTTLRAALQLDAVKVANEAEVLAFSLAQHADTVCAQHRARAPSPKVRP